MKKNPIYSGKTYQEVMNLRAARLSILGKIEKSEYFSGRSHGGRGYEFEIEHFKRNTLGELEYVGSDVVKSENLFEAEGDLANYERDKEDARYVRISLIDFEVMGGEGFTIKWSEVNTDELTEDE